MRWERDGAFTVLAGQDAVQVETVAALLAGTYWAHRRPREVVEKLVENSLCFSLLHEGGQIGFARVATDYTVFSWLSDLVVADEYRGRGLGKWLVECVLEHPSVAHTQFVLQTTTGHGFYESFGFVVSEKLMTRGTSRT